MKSEAMPKTRKPRGFQLMAHARLQEISSAGGKKAHEAGTAHKFTKAEASAAGKKGGLASGASRRARGDE